MFFWPLALRGARTLLGAPGLTTRNNKLLGAPGIATRNKDATSDPPWLDGRRALRTMLLGLLDKDILAQAARQEDAGQARETQETNHIAVYVFTADFITQCV